MTSIYLKHTIRWLYGQIIARRAAPDASIGYYNEDIGCGDKNGDELDYEAIPTFFATICMSKDS